MGWFRWHEGSCEDIKFRIVARNVDVTVADENVTARGRGVTVATVMGVWAMVLEDASHPDHRGVAARGYDFWSAVSGLEVWELERIFLSMEDVGLLTLDGENLTITRWHDRQFETDMKDNTNGDRQRRWREKRKGNGSVTAADGERNGSGRPDTDTDTDTEQKQKQNKPRATRVPAGEFEEWYAAFPKHVGRGAALKAYNGARKKTSHDVLMAGAAREAAKGGDPKYIKHPASWLNAECWLDEEPKRTRVMSDEERNAYRGVR
jgi:hypothetical protein